MPEVKSAGSPTKPIGAGGADNAVKEQVVTQTRCGRVVQPARRLEDRQGNYLAFIAGYCVF